MLVATLAFLNLISLGWTQIQPRGDLDATLETGIYSAASAKVCFGMGYSVPFASLTFVRDADGFLARFQVSLQVMDKQKTPVAAELWERTARADDFAATGAQDSVVSGVVEIELPEGAAWAQLEVADMCSDRRAMATVPIDATPSQLPMRVLRSGVADPRRTFGVRDTIQVLVELPVSAPLPESVLFAIARGKRVLLTAAVGVTESLGRSHARFVYAVADTEGTPRLGSGEYLIEATAELPGGRVLTSGTVFRVALPFFCDDNAYRAKVEQLVYVATAEEIRRLKSAPRAERERSWSDFWRPRDSNSATVRNEAEEDYFQRIEFAEENFRAGDNGYRSDRGSVYVRYGPPDQIDARPFEIDRPAEQTWLYYVTGKRFRFVDRYGSGMFVLVGLGDSDGW